MGSSELVKERWVVRASVAGLLGVLCFLAGFSILTQRSVEDTSRRADRAMRLSAIYQDARHWVSEEKSQERRYRFEGSSSVRLTHGAAESRLVADLRQVGGSTARPPRARSSPSCWTCTAATRTP